MYSVIDFYENPFGDRIFVSPDLDECLELVRMYEEEFDGECSLKILREPMFNQGD